jgi:hypothetical protein
LSEGKKKEEPKPGGKDGSKSMCMHNVLLEFYFLNIDYQQKPELAAAAKQITRQRQKKTPDQVDIHVPGTAN